MVCAFAAGTVAAAFNIRSGDIDHELARGGQEVQPGSVRKVIRWAAGAKEED